LLRHSRISKYFYNELKYEKVNRFQLLDFE